MWRFRTVMSMALAVAMTTVLTLVASGGTAGADPNRDRQIYPPGQCNQIWRFTFGAHTGNFLCDTLIQIYNHADGRDEAFGIGSNHQVYHAWQTYPGDRTATTWQSLGGIATGGVWLQDRAPTIAVYGSSGRPSCNGIRAGEWSGWFPC